MREHSITELWQLSKFELCAFAERIFNLVPMLPVDSPQRRGAEQTLHNIRLTLARRDFLP
ncbi:MAG TPA: hypothetical protein VH206_09650 [Xanthobacteraceae bacterium]|jgi:hypothetical protein|nr:hypothetical protein [Xanthobacteraceae bacterium]